MGGGSPGVLVFEDVVSEMGFEEFDTSSGEDVSSKGECERGVTYSICACKGLRRFTFLSACPATTPRYPAIALRFSSLKSRALLSHTHP